MVKRCLALVAMAFALIALAASTVQDVSCMGEANSSSPRGKAEAQLIPMDRTVSMSTKNAELLHAWPTVRNAFLVGKLTGEQLINKRIVIPVNKSVNITKKAMRSKATIRSAIEHALQEHLRSQLDDPHLSKGIYNLLSEDMWRHLEGGMQDSETAQSNLEWLLRFDASNQFQFTGSAVTTTPGSRALVEVEGGANVTLEKWILWKDSVVFQFDVILNIVSFDLAQLQRFEQSKKLKELMDVDPMDEL